MFTYVPGFWGYFQDCWSNIRFFRKNNVFFSFSGKGHAESSINFVKITFLDPKRAKLDQNSDFGHVRTYSWLHKLRNTQGKIYGTELGNIYIYIYMKPARGPQTEFFSNSCSGIPGLANCEMLNEVCEGKFRGTFFRPVSYTHLTLPTIIRV